MTSDLHPPPLETEPEPTVEQRPTPLLRRSTTDQVVGGVAGGLGRYLGIDPVVLRIAFVLLALSGGSGVLLYLIAWIAIPAEKPGDVVGVAPTGTTTPRTVIGAVVIAAGAVLLVTQFFPGFSQFVWPMALIALGVFVVLGGVR